MINKVIFNNWYKRSKFEYFGFKAEEPTDESIQECLNEFYQKFYEGGGRKFKPFAMNTKYFNFSKE